MGQVLSLEDVVIRRQELRAGGHTVVLTNGAFDLLHVGHLRYLQAARERGDCLIVALNNDDSVRSYKDRRRPIVPERERAELLAGLACVDYIVIFAEPTAEEVVKALKPDIYIKGGDYAPGGKELPEASLVLSLGGQVEILPFVANRSTTDIVKTILSRYTNVEISE